ncbi:MAG: CPBP family intramembrane metalloprotease [Deltaproteobacteria bacterium]|nr:CPBP family intramembrane metalloprotease [Deltaproteobacteria bacterium]
MKFRDLHPRRFFLDAWRDIDQESGAHKAASPNLRSDTLLAMYIYVVVAASLTLQDYFGGPDTFFSIIGFIDNPLSADRHPILWALVGWMAPDDGAPLYLHLEASGYLDLLNLVYWAGWRVLGFLVFPLVAVACHPRLRKERLGLSFAGFGKHAWVYGVLFAPVLAAVIIVSFTEEFSTYYPFYGDAHRSLFDFGVWELCYILQFLSLEFFFRGFMLQPLRRIMGSSAIYAMMIPYVMIHYGKPLPECFAAIIAGVVLGTLAMRTRSIWAGFLIHVSVALAMDIAAIWQTHW